MTFCGKIGGKRQIKVIFHTAAGADNSGNISLQYLHEDKAAQERRQKPKNQYIMEEKYYVKNQRL